MRRIMAVADRDGLYASRLAGYLNEQESIGFRTSAFSDLEAFREYRKNVHVEILLISEELARRAHGLTDGSKVILLSEDGFVGDGEKRPFGAPAVFKYLPADRMAREIMRLYSDDDSRSLGRAAAESCEILGIYSPVNRCGKTTLALTLGLVRARRGRTLLIPLEKYAGVYRNIGPEPETDLSDMIYCYLQGLYSWSRLKAAVHSFGGLDYIPPVRCMEDVSQLASEDMARLFRRIAEEGGYSTMIIDFGSFGRRAAELLELCGRIFMPVTRDPFSELKVAAFREYLERSGKEELTDRLVRCELPFEPEKMRDYANALLPVYEGGAMYDFAERLH